MTDKTEELFSDFLDFLAGDPDYTPVQIFEKLLASECPIVRSSAGRALMNIHPKLAVKMLPDRMEVEPNKFVRAVLLGAFRGAVFMIEEKL